MYCIYTKQHKSSITVHIRNSALKQSHTQCNTSGITLLCNFEISKAESLFVSLLDRHFFNYVLMLTISPEVESATLDWNPS